MKTSVDRPKKTGGAFCPKCNSTELMPVSKFGTLQDRYFGLLCEECGKRFDIPMSSLSIQNLEYLKMVSPELFLP